MIGLVALFAIGAAPPAPPPAAARLVLPFETGQLVLYFPNGDEDGCSAEGQGAFAPLAPTACASLGFARSASAGRHGQRGGLVMEVGRAASAPPFPQPAGITLLAEEVVEVDVAPSGGVGVCRVVHTFADPRVPVSASHDLCADLHGDSHAFLAAAGSAAPRHGTVRMALFTPAGAPAAAH